MYVVIHWNIILFFNAYHSLDDNYTQLVENTNNISSDSNIANTWSYHSSNNPSSISPLAISELENITFLLSLADFQKIIGVFETSLLNLFCINTKLLFYRFLKIGDSLLFCFMTCNILMHLLKPEIVDA